MTNVIPTAVRVRLDNLLSLLRTRREFFRAYDRERARAEFDAYHGDEFRGGLDSVTLLRRHVAPDKWELCREYLASKRHACVLHGGTTWKGGYCDRWVAGDKPRRPCVHG